MNKRLLVVIVSVCLLASPLLVSAQTVDNSNASLIALLTQLVQTLEQELAALESALSQGTTTGHITLPFSGIIASPQSGSAPLAVSFSGSVPGDHGYTIDFGDGSSPSVTPALSVTCPATNAPCPLPLFQAINQNHTYTANGTYTATLTSNGATVGTAAITVGGTPSSTFMATPQSGAAPLAVSFSTGPLNANDSYNITFGDGTSGSPSISTCNEVAGAGAACPYATTHTYAANGTYTATLYQSIGIFGGILFGCQNANSSSCEGLAIGSVIVTVGGTGTPYSNFSASPTFGTAPLAVHFWATVGVSSVLYNVNFGDGTSASLQPGGCPTVGEGPCTTPYADHTYTQTGTYTATLTGPCVQTDCTIGTVTVTVSQASRASGGSCIAYQTTYANGATIQYLGEPGPGIPETLGLFASQWTCSNGQWVSATQTTTSQSCTTPWGTTVASGQTAQGFCPGAGSIPAGGECGLTEMCSNSQWTPTTTVNPGPNNGGNPNTSCTFANTTEGSECGGLYMCGVGVDGEYWTTKYPCPPFS